MKKTNIPSAATARSVGMSFVEEYTDSEGTITAVWAITRSKWENTVLSR